MQTDASKVGIYLVNKSGAPVKEASVSIKTQKDTFTAKSGDSGLISVDSKRITNDFILSSPDKTLVDGENNRLLLSRPVRVFADTQTTALTYLVVVEDSLSGAESKGDGIVSVSVPRLGQR